MLEKMKDNLMRNYSLPKLVIVIVSVCVFIGVIIYGQMAVSRTNNEKLSQPKSNTTEIQSTIKS